MFWFDKIRMYQGYSTFNPDHERFSGDIIRSSSFQRLKASKRAEINVWEQARLSTAAQGRLKNRRHDMEETENIAKAIFVSEV